MLTRLRTALLRHRIGTAILWTLGVLMIAAVVGHAPLDALAGDHPGSDHASGGLVGDVPATDTDHHGDGVGADLSCSVGEALCAVGVVLGLFLLRRFAVPPPRAALYLRRIRPRPPGLAGVTRFLEAPDLARLVRLQI